MIECKCHACVGACKTKPGWFLPGEAELVAEYMGMPLNELFDLALMVDWWEDEPTTFVLSPAVHGHEGSEAPGSAQGECVFLVQGECSIHAVKPFECAQHIHTETRDDVHARHEAVAVAWKPYQKQSRELLGREPETQFDGGPFGSIFAGLFR